MAPTMAPDLPGMVTTRRRTAFFSPVTGLPRISSTLWLPFPLVRGTRWEQIEVKRGSL
ncbi:MAG: hypothetical protein ACD_75C01463G0007 [uncultured bacterium]|nr:MAG: hypothetical protein ACD_75C01463G0007 [uncultured bacterium]